MGFSISDRSGKRIRQAVLDVERLKPQFASQSGTRPIPTSSVWVSPTGTPTAGAYAGTFQKKNGSAWTSTGEDCYVKDPNGGTLTADKIYLGRITGADETDGLPIVEVVRPTASSSDCARSWLRLPDCATLTVTEALGACACITTGQTAALTKNASGALASEDLLYGCPPGVITTWCPSGAPRKWNLVVAGFTGGSTGFNHSYTLTYTTGETWTGTRCGITATLVQTADGSFTLTLNDGGGNTPSWTVTGVTDCCGDITLTLADADGTSGTPATLTATPATSCGLGTSYTPYLEIVNGDCGPCRKLSWVPTAGSGVRSIVFEQVECGTDADGNSYIEFSSADPLLCTDDETECGENAVIVRVTCGCVWSGAGYYCYWNPTLGTQACGLFSEPPAVADPYFTLLSGPYETSGECACSMDFGACCGSDMPSNYCIAVSGLGGIDPLFSFGDGTYFFGPNSASQNKLDGDTPEHDVITSVQIVCDGANFELWIISSTGGVATAFYSITLPGFCGNTSWPYAFDDGAGVTGTITSDLDCIDSPNCVRCLLNRSASLVVSGDVTASLGPVTASVGAGFVGYSFDGGGLQYNLTYDGTTWSFADSGTPWTNSSSIRSGNTITLVFTRGLTTATIEVAISDEVACEECEPISSTYICVDGTCTEVFDGSGSTLAACLSSCSGSSGGDGDPCNWVGQVATIVIGDGVYAGTYTATWTLSGGLLYLTFTPSGSAYAFTVLYNSVADKFVAAGGTGSVESTSYDCGTGVITFPANAHWYTTVSATVTT